MGDNAYYKSSLALPENEIASMQQNVNSWRIVTFICLVVIILQGVLVGYLLNTKKEYVYIARMSAGEKIENLLPLRSPENATSIEKQAFIRQYISNFVSLPLDPVVVRNNLLANYHVSGTMARQSLNHFIQTNNLLKTVGKETRLIHIRTFNAISPDSFQVTWDVITFNLEEKQEHTTAWSGVFTLTTHPGKKNSATEVFDPFGLQVEYFSLDQLGT